MSLSPRWKKVAGDVVQNEGRIAIMVISIALGMFAVGTISTAYTILGREIDRGYLATNPAAALIEVDHLDDATVIGARSQAGVAWAEVSGKIWSRIEVRPGEWLPLLLSIKQAFADQHIGTIQLEKGRWPADADEIMLESTAAAVAAAAVGQRVIVQTPNGTAHRLIVTGIAHDPSVAPASQQQVVYGYATPATLERLGESRELHTLNLTVTEPGSDQAHVDRSILDAARRLQHSGHVVREIRIPPRHHPHWAIMNTLVRMLLALSVMTLLLSAVLTATLTATLLAPQARQIGMMKAIGAGRIQVMRLYAGLVAVIGAGAVGMGLPAGILAGRSLAAFIAHNQNLDLDSLSIPVWEVCVQVLTGTGLPLALSLIPVWNSARRPVRDLLNTDGVASPPAGRRYGRSGIMRSLDIPVLTLVVRNTFRRRGRLMLTLGLLATAGALFITSLNILEAWKRNLVDARVERHCDIEIPFAKPLPYANAIVRVSALAGVKKVEPFTDESVAVARDDELSITRTFPDGGHGSLRLDALPIASAFVSPTVTAGQWLSSSDPAGAVVNGQALAFFPGIRIGDRLFVNVHGHNVRLNVVGIVREHLASATIYISSEAHANGLDERGIAGGLRVELESERKASASEIAAAIEHTLEVSGHRVSGSIIQAQLGRELLGHLFILIFIMIVMSLLMAFVGMLGLASAMTTSMLERTRELGVMRAIGASKGSIRCMVLSEGMLIGIMSVGIASLLSLPLTLVVENAVGTASLGPALSAGMSNTAIPIWLAIVVIGAVLATEYPARKVSNLTIREALVY